MRLGALLQELLPGDVMLSLDGSQITVEAVLKSQDHVTGIAYESAALNSTSMDASSISPAAGAPHTAHIHPMTFMPPVPPDGCPMYAVQAPPMAYSMVSPVPVGAAAPGAVHSPLTMPLAVDGSQVKGPAASKAYLPVSTEDLASGYIPSCTRPYGMTIDELLGAWPVREWCAAPTRTEVESLVTQCQALNKSHGGSAAPKVTQFDLPPEQLVYALAMLANWDCARVYQVLTTIDVDFRAIALRLPQAGLWFRCQPTMAEVQPNSSVPARSPIPTHLNESTPTQQPNGISHATSKPDAAHSRQAACQQEAKEVIAQLAAKGHTAEDASLRRQLDCVAVKVCIQSTPCSRSSPLNHPCWALQISFTGVLKCNIWQTAVVFVKIMGEPGIYLGRYDTL